jgi:hypothetical protein
VFDDDPCRFPRGKDFTVQQLAAQFAVAAVAASIKKWHFGPSFSQSEYRHPRQVPVALLTRRRRDQ